jgi:hypothetical protein
MVFYFIYIFRNLIELIPSPFEGFRGWRSPKTFEGYRHLELIELNLELPYMMFVIDTDTSMIAKINLLINYTKL